MNINVGENNGGLRKAVYENADIVNGEHLAKSMMVFADDNSSSVSELEFQNMLKKMKKLSPHQMVQFIRSFDKKESVIELICDEIGNGKDTRKKACKDVLNALVTCAKSLGIETSGFEADFNKELDSQFTGLAKYINTEKLDSILSALVQQIENRQDLTSEDMEMIQNTSAEDAANATTDILNERLSRAFASFGERIDENGEWTNRDENGELLNGQLQQDGWAADTADFISKIWNNELYGNEHGNTAKLVRKDLRTTHDQLAELRAAAEESEDAYKAKFKEIFGVDYDYKNIVSYQKVEQEYMRASLYNELEKAYNREFKTLLSKGPLRDEYTHTTMNSTAGAVTQSVLSATKQQVYDREFNRLAGYLGQDGVAILNSKIAEAGLEGASIDEKFEVLKQIASEISAQYHKNTAAVCDGQDFATIEARYENSYKAAYGIENDVMKRVTDYNRSQQVGAMAVKMTVVVAASLAAGYGAAAAAAPAAASAAAAGGTAVMSASTASTLGSALGASAATFLVEVSDDLTTTKALEAWANGDFETLKDCVDWAGIAKQAAVSGVMIAGFGTVSRGVQILTVSLSPAAQGAAMFGANMAFGLGSEYIMTGEISVQGVIMTGVFSIVAGVLQFHAANVTKQAEEVVKQQLQQEIANARNILGIDDSVEITAEMLKTIKRDMALQLHPDKFGGKIPTTASGHTMGDVNAAIDLLQKNLAGSTADVNAGVAAAQAASSADDAGMAVSTQVRTAEATYGYPVGQNPTVVAKAGTAEATYGYPIGQNPTTTALAEAGFTDDVIAQMRSLKIYGGQSDVQLVNETLKTVQYLEEQVAAGRSITRELVEEAIGICHPGGSGYSSSVVRNWIANNWRYGDEVYNVYGQRAPGQAVLSKGNLKAKYNKVKYGIKETIEDVKMDLGIDKASRAARKPAAPATSAEPASFESQLATVKGPDGKALLSQAEISNLLNSKTGLGGEPIPNFEERVLAVLNDPKAVAEIYGWNSRSAGIWRHIQDPLNSTVEANPAAFGRNPAAPATPAEPSNQVVEGFAKARSTNDLDLLVRQATTIEDLDYIVSQLQAKDIVVNQSIIESIIDDAINKKNILQGGSRIVTEEVYTGTGETKIYNTEGNLVETIYTVDGVVVDAIKYSPNGDYLPTKQGAGKWYILEEAGFTDDVVQSLKTSGGYSPEVVDEALDLILYLEQQVNSGEEITKELIAEAYAMYSLDTHKRAYMQIISQNWRHGDKVTAAITQTSKPTATTVASTKPVLTGELDLSFGAKYSNIDNFMAQCETYASERGLTVSIEKHKEFGDPVVTFKDKAGNPVRELLYIGDELFDDTFTTYNSSGKVVNKTRYMADDGRLADNIQYFYDADGNVTYSTKLHTDGDIDVAIWSNGKGMRQGPGVFYTKAQAEAKYGIVVDDSMLGTTASDAAAKLATTQSASTDDAGMVFPTMVKTPELTALGISLLEDAAIEANISGFVPHIPEPGSVSFESFAFSDVPVSSAFAVEPANISLIKHPAKKAPDTPIFPAAPKPVRTQAEFKEALLSAEMQETFYVKGFQEWADDMGLTMTIERSGQSRIALFKDSDGNIVRRITENDSAKGSVYDDRIFYYENGKHVSGKYKYTDEPYTFTYDVDANGFLTNHQKVYPQDSFKTRLMDSTHPTEFNPTALQTWADDMGLTMTIEQGSSRIAIFKDAQGNVVRRITENDFAKGTVYDDKTWYYEGGRQVAGKTKYYFEDAVHVYDVDVLGNVTNMRQVTPKSTPVTTATAEPASFESQLAAVKGPDGKALLSQAEISTLLKNCKDIPNYQERILAVLSNPEEVAGIAGWKSPSAGVWKAIQDPLNSTVEANPAAFGVKPKASVAAATKQKLPSQDLSKVVVDRVYGGKAEAEAIVFGNGTIREVREDVVVKAVKALREHFGKEITVYDLQIIRSSEGTFIGYFDPETNLSTVFSINGQLNGQFEIVFDAQGNIEAYNFYSIYVSDEGKFYLK